MTVPLLDAMPAITNPTHRDLCLRWAPTGTQIDSAKHHLAAHPGGKVIVALVLLRKEYGIWDVDVEVRPVDGAWLTRSDDTYHEAVNAACEAGAALLGSRIGTVSWVDIRPDGSWAVFEDIRTTRNRKEHTT